MKSGTEQTILEKRRRQFLLFLPVLVFPFLTILLWSAGVVGEGKAQKQKAKTHSGLNTSLPDAQFSSEKGWTKLSYYQQADEDSAKYRQALQSDPYFKDRLSVSSDTDTEDTPPDFQGNLLHQEDPNIAKVNQKLAELNKALEQSSKPQPKSVADIPVDAGMRDRDIDRLENVLKSANAQDGQADPEMQQLSQIMDKIIAVQHPEILQDSLQRLSAENLKQAYPVILSQEDNISLLQNNLSSFEIKDTASQLNDSLYFLQSPNHFYGLDDIDPEGRQQNTVRVIIPETQSLVNGSVLKLCLTDDIYIGGILIPKGNLIYGTVRLNGERLLVDIQSIREGNNILPVALSAYDLDGMAGIYIPGAITRDVAKQSGDQAIQGIGLTTLDPSLGAQAASAGIQAAKSLISRKVKLVKVTVKAGYQILLKDNNNQ